MSQESDILGYLMDGGTLTPLDALHMFDCLTLSQRCTALRQQGYPIRSEMIKTPTGKRVAQYRLESSDNNNSGSEDVHNNQETGSINASNDSSVAEGWP